MTLRDAATIQPINTLPKQFPWIGAIARASGGHTLAVDHGMGIKISDAGSACELGSFPFHSKGTLAFSPDGNRLAGLTDSGEAIDLIKDARSRSPAGSAGESLRSGFPYRFLARCEDAHRAGRRRRSPSPPSVAVRADMRTLGKRPNSSAPRFHCETGTR